MPSFVSTAFLAVAFAVAVSAAPLSLRQDSCDIASCGVALGPTGVGCVSAAVKLGADPFADAGCIAGVTNLGVNTPGACSACLDIAKEKVPEFFSNVGDKISDTFDDVTDSIGDLFSRQDAECDLAACGVALAPTGVGCVSAAVKLGADPFADAGCIAGITNLGVNTPAACSACLGSAPEFFSDVGDKISDTFDDVTDSIGDLFSRQEEEQVEEEVPEEEATCDLLKCGVALGPTGVSCVSALALAGANLISDAGCVASVLNLGLNTPASCQACVDDLKEKVPEPLQPVVEFASDVKETVNDKVDGVVDEAKDFFGGLFDREEESCDIAACGVALGPTSVGCVSAAVKLGADPFADAGCVAGLTNLGVNTPAACAPCVSGLKEKVPEFFSDVGDKVSDTFDDVTDGISGLFD